MLAHFLTSFKVYNATLVSSTSREEVGDQLAYAMKLIIIPLLSRSFELGQHEIVGDANVDSMVKDMFDPAEEVQGEVAAAAIEGVLECSQMAVNSKNNLASQLQSSNSATTVVCNQHVIMLYSVLHLHMQASIQMPSTWSCFKWQHC